MGKKAIVDFEIKGADGLSMIKQLEDRTRKLRKEWRYAEDSVERYKKAAELKKANTELRRHRKMIYDTDTAWQKFKKTAMPIAGGFLGANLIQSATNILSTGITKITRRTGELEEQYADIMKTTGLLKSEVVELDAELSKLNTRTTRRELRELAVQAGRLGKSSKEDILEFVESADIINVALTELGDDGVLKIGKVADAFGVGMQNIGSAINSVGAASAAQETYLVDFLARLQGSGKTANISAADIIGYGAVLDSLGLQVEMSSTALNNFFIDFTKNTEAFERAAGMANGSLSKLIGERGSNEGFLTFLQTLKETSASKAEFLQRLDELGIKGSREAQVILTLSNNLGKVREQQALSNREFEKGTSLLDEFNIKNNNTAATLEKISKWWDSFYENGALKGLVDEVIGAFGRLIGVVDKSDQQMQQLIDQYGQVEQLEKHLNPLIDRHDELREKTELSKDEQKELNTIINRVAEAIPYAITEVDEYGKALGISTSKAREFVEAQRAMLRVQNADYINTLTEEIDQLRSSFKMLDNQIESGQKRFLGTAAMAGQSTRAATQDEIAAMRVRQAEIGAQIRQKELALNGFQGIFPSSGSDAGTNAGGNTGSDTGNAGGTGGSSAGSGPTKLPPAIEKTIRTIARESLDLEQTLLTLKYGALQQITLDGEEQLAHLRMNVSKSFSESLSQYDETKQKEDLRNALFNLEQKHQAELFALEMKGISELENQEFLQAQKLELEESYLLARQLLRQTYGERSISEEDTLLDVQRRKQLEYKRFEEEINREKIQSELELQAVKEQSMLGGLSLLRSVFEETTGIYKALFLAEKAYAIAQVIINGIKEVSSLRTAQAAAIAYAKIIPGVGIGLAATAKAAYEAQIITSKINTGIRVATIAAQTFGQIRKKEKGGFTDMQSLGYTQGAGLYGSLARPYIAGEKGQEFVTSFQSLQNPVVANFTQLLDAAQKSGDYTKLEKFSGKGNMNAAVVQQLKALNQNIEKIGKRPLVFNHYKFEKYNDFINEIRKSVTA